MDLSAPIAYNGVTLTPSDASPTAARGGVEIKDVDISPIGVDAFRDGRGVADGEDVSDVYLRARTLTIQASVYGTTKGDLFDRLQDVLAAFNPSNALRADPNNLGFLPLTFRQPTIDTATWTAGYIPMKFLARPTTPPRYSINAVKTADGGRGMALPVTLQLIAADPRKYNQTQLSQSLTTTSTTSVYRGDFPTMPIVTFSLSANGNSAFTVVSSGTSVVINLASAYLSVPAMKNWLLDFGTRTLYQGITSWSKRNPDGVPRDDLLSTASVFEPFDGGSILVTSLTGFSAAPAFKYNEAWA